MYVLHNGPNGGAGPPGPGRIRQPVAGHRRLFSRQTQKFSRGNFAHGKIFPRPRRENLLPWSRPEFFRKQVPGAQLAFEFLVSTAHALKSFIRISGKSNCPEFQFGGGSHSVFQFEFFEIRIFSRRVTTLFPS